VVPIINVVPITNVVSITNVIPLGPPGSPTAPHRSHSP
jgi:hypothetical protein